MTIAIEKLENPVEGKLHPASMLRLGWHYNVFIWFKPCIQELLAPYFKELGPLDMDDLESDILSIISQTRVRILKHRFELIMYCPDAMHVPDCHNRGACVKNWQLAFSSAMLFFAHTRKVFSGREVFEKLSSVDIPNFNPGCRRLTLDTLEVNGVLWREEAFRDLAIDAITNVLKCKRPKTPCPPRRFITSPTSDDEKSPPSP